MTSRLDPLDSPFDGQWWSAEDPDHVVGGRLYLDGDVWRLLLLGWLGPWDHGHRQNDIPPLIHGRIGGAAVSLLGLVPGGWSASLASAPHEARIAVNTVIVGLHATASTTFKAAGVRLLHLNEWANRSPWDFDMGSPDVYQHIVTFTDPGELVARLPGATARLWRGWGQTGGGLSGLTMTSDEWIHFEFDAPQDLETIEHDWVRPLGSLIELASDRTSPTLELTLVPEDAEEPSWHASVLSAAPRRPPAAPRHPFQLIFTLDDMAFDAVLSSWWKLHLEIGTVVDLVAALRDGRGYVSEKFLTGASAVEGYHRHRFGRSKPSEEHRKRVFRIVEAAPSEDRDWLRQRLAFSHEPTFAERVDAVVDRAGPLFPPAVGDVIAWRNWVKAGRNSVAHRDPTMVDLDEEWRVTVRITATLRWLMTLVLLRDLGIPDSVLEKGVRREQGLHSVSKQLEGVRPDWFN